MMETFAAQSSTEKVELLPEPNHNILEHPDTIQDDTAEKCHHKSYGRFFDKIKSSKRGWRTNPAFSYSVLGSCVGLALLILACVSMTSFFDGEPYAKCLCVNTSNPEADKGWSAIKSYLKDKNWDSELLFYALQQKDEDVIKVLVQVGTDLNGRNEKLETPLITAASADNKTESLQLIKYFIEHGANVFAHGYNNRTFLHTLVSDGSTLTPTQFGDIAEFLISQNASELFNIPEGDNGASPLMLAVKNLEVEPEMLKVLHDNKVNLNLIDKHGNSVFYYALEGKRSLNLMSALVALGTDWKILNNYSHSLLHLAAHFCYVEGLKYFLSLGLDINAIDEYGGTPLHQTAFFGKEGALETMEVLIENGAKIDTKDVSGSIPLDYVMIRGDGNEDLVDKEKIVQLLQDNL